jgi:hypothetical protein
MASEAWQPRLARRRAQNAQDWRKFSRAHLQTNADALAAV